MEDDSNFWVEQSTVPLSLPRKRKRNVRPKRLEFVGWGSKPLIEFLESLGKDPSKKLSQQEVTAIVKEYVIANSLTCPKKKKKIVCDQKLHALFGKKVLYKIKIHDMLEAHFAENQDSSEDEFHCSSEEDGIITTDKKTSNSEQRPSFQKKKAVETPKSCFAAIIPENIKLVYLKRTLVQDLAKHPESFEAKVLGSFVRVKSDPNDYLQKNRHQIQQVVGVKGLSMGSEPGNAGGEVLLQLSNYIKDVPIHMLSEDNFLEEELEDLHEKVQAGLLKKPTVVELEVKAKMLHKDIIKHWIPREIALLQKLIDRANEKGWRREMYEYSERKQLLQKPSEEERLLSETPNVVAEELDSETTQEALGKLEGNSSPELLIGRATDTSHAEGIERKQLLQKPSEQERLLSETPNVVAEELDSETTQEALGKLEGNSSPELVIGRATDTTHAEGIGSVDIAMSSGVTQSYSHLHREENEGFLKGFACSRDLNGSVDIAMSSGVTRCYSHLHREENEGFLNGFACSGDLNECQFANPVELEAGLTLSSGDECGSNAGKNKKMQRVDLGEDTSSLGGLMREVEQPKVIELSDDDETETGILKNQNLTAYENLEELMWYYLDPQGCMQGAFSISSLKRWSDSCYFSPNFMVWRKDQGQDKAVLLHDVLQRYFPLK